MMRDNDPRAVRGRVMSLQLTRGVSRQNQTGPVLHKGKSVMDSKMPKVGLLDVDEVD